MHTELAIHAVFDPFGGDQYASDENGTDRGCGDADGVLRHLDAIEQDQTGDENGFSHEMGREGAFDGGRGGTAGSHQVLLLAIVVHAHAREDVSETLAEEGLRGRGKFLVDRQGGRRGMRVRLLALVTLVLLRRGLLGHVAGRGWGGGGGRKMDGVSGPSGRRLETDMRILFYNLLDRCRGLVVHSLAVTLHYGMYVAGVCRVCSVMRNGLQCKWSMRLNRGWRSSLPERLQVKVCHEHVSAS